MGVYLTDLYKSMDLFIAILYVQVRSVYLKGTHVGGQYVELAGTGKSEMHSAAPAMVTSV